MPSPFPGMDPYLEGSLWASLWIQRRSGLPAATRGAVERRGSCLGRRTASHSWMRRMICRVVKRFRGGGGDHFKAPHWTFWARPPSAPIEDTTPEMPYPQRKLFIPIARQAITSPKLACGDRLPRVGTIHIHAKGQHATNAGYISTGSFSAIPDATSAQSKQLRMVSFPPRVGISVKFAMITPVF